jgi:DNA-binding response OmpR family regulator
MCDGAGYVHVNQLRRKLAAADPDGALRDLIVTEPGVGYRVRELDQTATLEEL